MQTDFEHRAYTTCSSWKLFHYEVQKITSILSMNNYPIDFINRIINRFLNNKLKNDNDKRTVTDERNYVIKLPYIGISSIILSKKLRQIFRKYDVNIRTVFTSFKVKNYFSLKAKTDSSLRSSLVYKFQCLRDSNSAYIGKTKRYLFERVNEHKKPNSAVFEHISDCTHCQSNPNLFSSFKTLDKANNDFDLQILEAINIITSRPKLNTQLANNGTSYVLSVF